MSKPTTILLIEDDVNLALPLVVGLQDEGFRALHAVDGHWGLKLARAAQPDLILLDVGLPGMDGFAVCRTLRHGSGQALRLSKGQALRQASAVPILLLTERGQERERIRGLELGADGCLVKPFSLRELLARVRTLLRRREPGRGNGSPASSRTVVGDIMLDRIIRQVWRAGRPIRLRRREFDLLSALMENAGKAIPRRELLGQVWGEDWIGDPRTLDVHICWLREKLGDDSSAPRYIQTLRGYGHRFVDIRD